MPRAPFAIGEHSVAPGGRATIDLPVSHLSDHTPVSMSVHVIHGKSEGPVVFVSAGIHGDEVIGVEIVRRLLRATARKAVKGTLIVIPIVNAFGFMNHSRYLPDRRDLNRSFPGSPALGGCPSPQPAADPHFTRQSGDHGSGAGLRRAGHPAITPARRVPARHRKGDGQGYPAV